MGHKVVFLVLSPRRAAVTWLEEKIDVRPKIQRVIQALESICLHVGGDYPSQQEMPYMCKH